MFLEVSSTHQDCNYLNKNTEYYCSYIFFYFYNIFKIISIHFKMYESNSLNVFAATLVQFNVFLLNKSKKKNLTDSKLLNGSVCMALISRDGINSFLYVCLYSFILMQLRWFSPFNLFLLRNLPQGECEAILFC